MVTVRHPLRSRARPPALRRRPGEQGYNLVVLLVLVTVMNVAIAVALPAWSKFMQREKETEAIFRGLQYAEAIRVFQKRHARLPNTLEELIEIEPRAIRKLYPNPLHEGGKWGILLQSAGGPGAGGQGQGPRGGIRSPLAPPGQRFGDVGQSGAGVNPALVAGMAGQPGRYVAVPPPAEGEEEESAFGRPRGGTTGPIVGVYPATDAPSQRTFFGQDNYSGWHFTVSLIPLPVVVGDRGMPRVTSEWIGKPFREDLVSPPDGGAPDRGEGRRSRDEDRGKTDGDSPPDGGEGENEGG
jgi:type II secretory pathway pseudopilin PulG